VKEIYDSHFETLQGFKEEIKKNSFTCRHHMLCYEVECPYNHSGVSQEGRKLIIKDFKTYVQKKKVAEKIKEDIKKIKSGDSQDWADMC